MRYRYALTLVPLAAIIVPGPVAGVMPRLPSPVTDIAGFRAEWEDIGGLATINVPEEALGRVEHAIAQSGIAACDLIRPEIGGAMSGLASRNKFNIEPGEVDWPTFVDPTVEYRDHMRPDDDIVGTSRIKIRHPGSNASVDATLRMEDMIDGNGNRRIQCEFRFAPLSEADVTAAFGGRLSDRHLDYGRGITWSLARRATGSFLPDGSHEQLWFFTFADIDTNIISGMTVEISLPHEGNRP